MDTKDRRLLPTDPKNRKARRLAIEMLEDANAEPEQIKMLSKLPINDEQFLELAKRLINQTEEKKE